MRFRTAGNILLGAVVALMLPAVTEAKVCLALYQMADNNLEYYLRQDYEELTSSPVISSENLRTWIYYDALNQGGQPLPDTVSESGAELTSTYTGSRYVTYDAGIGEMRVDMELSGEQNSDTQESVQGFLEHAFNDCNANGYTSVMAVFSSHGGGFAGYGGDENTRNRKLLQTNQAIAASIRAALDNTGIAPKLEVLGFDACLMQAVGAADDYKDVAQYFLASEAVEPGHGWAYSYLTTADSALSLAQQILDTFLSETQGGSSHQSPKTMAILDTDKFNTFITALESFSADLLTQLQAGDTSLHTFVGRARSSAVAFESIVDAVGTQNPSGLDLGSWLDNFYDLCNPGEPLGTDLQTARDAYANMFVARGVGPGTSPGTGMEITWPNQGEFQANTALWEQVLFSNVNYVTQIIPNFRAFLQWFLTSSTPSGGGDTICGLGAEPDASAGGGGDAGTADAGENSNTGSLIIQDSGVLDTATGLFNVDATIAPAVSQVLVEYGIDLSTPLKPVLEEKGYEPNDDEYLILLGGDVAGTYQGATFSCTWDQNFYFLNITATNTFEALYVFDQGDGSRKIPAMYFPEERREDVANLQFLDYLFFDFDYWVEQGARFSFLKFSMDDAEGRINDNLSLFISNEVGVFAEQPRSARGMMIPLIYIDAYIQGRKLKTLPGGFNQTVINWSEELEYNILTTPTENIFNVIPGADAVVVNMYAFDHADPTVEPDARYYDVRRDRGTKPTFIAGDSAVNGGPQANPSAAVSFSSGFALLTGLAFVFFTLL